MYQPNMFVSWHSYFVIHLELKLNMYQFYEIMCRCHFWV